MNLAEAVECCARGRWPGRQQLTRVLRVPRRIAPVAPQLHDFGTIDQALAAITHEIWLRGTPLRERPVHSYARRRSKVS